MSTAQGNTGRVSTVRAAFVIGLPLAIAALLPFQKGSPLHGTEAARYVSHPVECVEVVMFCCALGALAAKLWQNRGERAALSAKILPAWNGQAVSVSEASSLLESTRRLPRRVRNSFLARRIEATLDFLRSRGSAAQLDDQLRALADADAIAQENSGALIRFITWAIPILGFLGTVVGITGAIAGVNPEVLEHDLSRVTDGLAEAFDTTALALGLTMITMLLSFLVERAEQGVLESVDAFADRELAHRFERAPAGDSGVAAVVQQSVRSLVEANERLVKQQAEAWARAIEEIDKRRAEVDRRQHERITAALETALEKTLEGHTKRLSHLEKQFAEQQALFLKPLEGLAAMIQQAGRDHLAGLQRMAEKTAAQAEALAKLQAGEGPLRRLQEALNHNLAALTATGTFEQAMHSLTAAIHLMTARGGTTQSRAAA